MGDRRCGWGTGGQSGRWLIDTYVDMQTDFPKIGITMCQRLLILTKYPFVPLPSWSTKLGLVKHTGWKSCSPSPFLAPKLLALSHIRSLPHLSYGQSIFEPLRLKEETWRRAVWPASAWGKSKTKSSLHQATETWGPALGTAASARPNTPHWPTAAFSHITSCHMQCPMSARMS